MAAATLSPWAVVGRAAPWCAAGILVVLAACAVEEERAPGPASEPGREATRISPLEAEFEAAAAEFAVPASVLKAVSWIESRWWTPPLPLDPEEDEPGHSPPSFGVMGLREVGGTLPLASRLTGIDEGALALDRPSNIRGAAAALRHLAEQDHGLDEGQRLPLELWPQVAARYSAGDDEALRGVVAAELTELLRTGMVGVTEEGLQMRIEGHGRAELPAFVTREQGLDYPGAIWNPAHSGNYSARNRTPANITHITIHVTQGSYAGAISWFRNPSSNVSAHYVIRSSDGQITQMVAHKDMAWHVGSQNGYTIGIEHEGWVTQPQWFTDEMYRSSARLTRHIADTWGVPLDRQHIKGHVEFPDQTHTDPGPHWDWSRYMALVRGEDAGPAKGNLVGFVREGDIMNTDSPVAGVQIRLNGGQTVQTDARGFYRFDGLNMATYTLTASKEGWNTVTSERALEVEGGDTWRSLALTRAAPPEPEPPAALDLISPPARPAGDLNARPATDDLDGTGDLDGPGDSVQINTGCALAPGSPAPSPARGLILIAGIAMLAAGLRRRAR